MQRMLWLWHEMRRMSRTMARAVRELLCPPPLKALGALGRLLGGWLVGLGVGRMASKYKREAASTSFAQVGLVYARRSSCRCSMDCECMSQRFVTSQLA